MKGKTLMRNIYRLLLIYILFGTIISETRAQITFPFFDSVENDSLSKTYWTPDSGTWEISFGGYNSNNFLQECKDVEIYIIKAD